MNNFKRANTRSSKIKDNFSRDIEGENRKKFIKNLLLLLLGIGFIIFLIFNRTPPPKPGEDGKPKGEVDTIAKIKPDAIVDIRPSIQIRSTSLNPDAVFGNFKASFESRAQDYQINKPSDSLFDFVSFYINSVNNNIVTSLNVKPGNQGYSKFRLVLNPLGKPKESLNNTLFKNQGSVRMNTQSLNGFEYHLIGIK